MTTRIKTQRKAESEQAAAESAERHGAADVYSATLRGADALPILVTARVESGLPSFVLDKVIAEAAQREIRIRVESAIKTSGFRFPDGRITIGVNVGNLTKIDGTAFDLPIALAILGASGQLPKSNLGGLTKTDSGPLVFGELSLGGEIRPVRGALAIAEAARSSGKDFVFCASENGQEAVLGFLTYSARTLRDAVEFFRNRSTFSNLSEQTTAIAEIRRSGVSKGVRVDPDFSDIRGNQRARRAAEIAAAGGHNLMIVGPPGAGKTMIARRVAGILPEMTNVEALRVTRLHGIAGLNIGGGLIEDRPFRAPHHSTTAPGLVGGGASLPRPGEITLAQHGVLFLDEAPEFQRAALEVLREPLASGEVELHRAAGTLRFPAKPAMVVASSNPCPCGRGTGTTGGGSLKRRCTCDPESVKRYNNARIPEAFKLHFDVRVETELVDVATLDGPAGESSSAIRERVVKARERQIERQGKLNGEMTTLAAITARMSTEAIELLDKYRLGNDEEVSRVLRVTRTIADLAGLDEITDACLSEALQVTK